MSPTTTDIQQTVAQKRKDAYRRTFKDEGGTGAVVLQDLMHTFGLLANSYHPEKSAADVAFDEGQRRVVIYILEQLDMRFDNVHELIDKAMHSPYEPSLEGYVEDDE